MDIFTWRNGFKDIQQWEAVQMEVWKALRAQKGDTGCSTETVMPVLSEPATQAHKHLQELTCSPREQESMDQKTLLWLMMSPICSMWAPHQVGGHPDSSLQTWAAECFHTDTGTGIGEGPEKELS